MNRDSGVPAFRLSRHGSGKSRRLGARGRRGLPGGTEPRRWRRGRPGLRWSLGGGSLLVQLGRAGAASGAEGRGRGPTAAPGRRPGGAAGLARPERVWTGKHRRGPLPEGGRQSLFPAFQAVLSGSERRITSQCIGRTTWRCRLMDPGACQIFPPLMQSMQGPFLLRLRAACC